jgi:membrane-bound lytic murein transglycosylase D
VAQAQHQPAVKKSKGRRSRRSSARRGRSATVRRGDTLGAIARRNGTTVAKLRRLNGIRGNNIRAGQKLRVK